MEWKAYYDTELRQADSRERITRWLLHASQEDVSAVSRRRTIFSFPHTALEYSGPLQARIVSNLYRNGIQRVIALGVVHGSMVPEYGVACDERASIEERLAGIAHVSGAFVPEGRVLETPFGALAMESMVDGCPAVVRVDHGGLLGREFSLDIFHAVLRLAADVFRIDPLPVLPVYVGMTRNPLEKSFNTAASLSEWLRDQWDDQTAIVTTGDVVHYGAFYGSEDEGSEPEGLNGLFLERLDDLFTAAFTEQDLESAYQISLRGLKSDQREILPVLAHLLGDGAEADVTTFNLSDYAAILDTPSPCLVASALIAYKTSEMRRN